MRSLILVVLLTSCASQAPERRALVERVDAGQAVVRVGQCDLSPGDVVHLFRRDRGRRAEAVGDGVVASASNGEAVVQLAPDAHARPGDLINADSPASYWHPDYRRQCN